MRIIVLGKKLRKKLWKNKKKTAGGVSSSQDWSQKESLCKINLFLEKALALLPLDFGVLGVLGDPLVLEYEL